MVAATKRMVARDPVQKEPREEGMSLEHIMNQQYTDNLQPHTVLKLPNKKGKSRKVTSNSSSLQKTLWEHVTKYHLIAEPPNAPSGLSIRPFWRGDATEAQGDLRRLLFHRRRVKSGKVVAMKSVTKIII